MDSKFVGGVSAAVVAAVFSAYGLAAASDAHGAYGGRALLSLALAMALFGVSFLLLRAPAREEG